MDELTPEEREQALELWKVVIATAKEQDANATYRGTDENESSQTGGSASLTNPPNISELTRHISPTKEKAETDNYLNNYLFYKEIASGGMGTIFQARQKNLYRDVAVKKIKSSTTISSKKKKRFIAEAVATAFLDHPNIIPVHELGRDENGELMISMKLVKGTPWNKILRPTTEQERQISKQYTGKQHLEILISVCNAIAFAHSKNIVHNDLKPENIIIGEFGEVLVMDWGLAVDLQENRELPIMKKKSIKRPMGTPNYIAPELALGDGEAIGTWTDVYLLGAVLYEILAKKPPHKASTLQESLLIAIEKRPAKLGQEVPNELALICYKALKKNRKYRFQTVKEFQQGIQDFLEHRESMKIAIESKKLLAHCQLLLKKNSPEQLDRAQLYDKFAQAVAGFRQATLLWQGNGIAARARQEAHSIFAKVALQNDDLGLAEAQVAELQSNHPEAAKLRQEIEHAKILKERSQKMLKRLRWGMVSTIGIILIGMFAFILLIRYEQKQTALSYASLYTKSLGEFRAFYSSQIVSRAKTQGMKITHDYTKNNEIPFPATFSIELAKKISEGEDGLKARLFSDYPFPWRAKEGGAKDLFERDALVMAKAYPDEPYFSIEVVNGIRSMRFSKAVVLKKSCVNCHNTHPLTPKNDWEEGDVRGVQEIIIPLGSTTDKLKDIAKEFFDLKFFILLFAFLAVFGALGFHCYQNDITLVTVQKKLSSLQEKLANLRKKKK